MFLHFFLMLRNRQRSLLISSISSISFRSLLSFQTRLTSFSSLPSVPSPPQSQSESERGRERNDSRLVSDMTDIEISFHILRMVRNFRGSGHFMSTLDPLAMSSSSILSPENTDHFRQSDICQFLRSDEPNYRVFNLQNVPLDKPFYLGKELKSMGKEYWTLRELVSSLRDLYCGNVGVEYLHIENNRRRKWIEGNIEGKYGLSRWNTSTLQERKIYFDHLLRSDHTSAFLGKRFSSAKIFGLEGSEALLPALWAIVNSSSEMGVDYIEMGMAHRGRMNVLHNFFEKSLGSICHKFNESEYYSGDVKFHLGARANLRVGPTERTVQVSLCANPSHLEAVYPVVIGKTKAKQFYVGDKEMKRVIPLVLHGDAAFAGQGIVPETMQLSNLPDYKVGGTIHIIVNNQIGFTTDPQLARTSYHCTNIAKMIEAPIFHVNGDDIDAVISVCKLAVEYRQLFQRDVVIDIVCYRKHGHSNKEDPKITQPLAYQVIENHPSTVEIYSNVLINDGVLTQEEINTRSEELMAAYTAEYQKAKEYVPDPLEWLASNWQATSSCLGAKPYNQTGVRMESLHAVGQALSTIPDHIKPHPDVKHIFDNRKRQIEIGEIAMPFAELLAFGTLLTRFKLDHLPPDPDMLMMSHPTVHVRLSGQDCVRGTFNQRHAGIFCQVSGQRYDPLSHIPVKDQPATFSVCNSSLSEAAVLAFEYGYSLENEEALTVWEAQFGDFANNAQGIIDNFITSGEAKWNVHSSLVMLLPHGYDGQGPEHTSARIERFLQLIDDSEDHIPGSENNSRVEIETAFENLVASNPLKNSDGESIVSKKELIEAMLRASPGNQRERLTLTIKEMLEEVGEEEEEMMTKENWVKMMLSWLQHNSERKYNFSVVVPSTPAQYFHCLRRQMYRYLDHYAKPLTVMTSKWLLHHKPCVSPIADFAPGSFFRRVIIEGRPGDNMRNKKNDQNLLLEPPKIRRVIFCSGKIFYHLYHARNAGGIKDIVFIRLEQIAPFPYDLIAKAIRMYPNAELMWVQEEARNMGAWTYIKPRFDTTLREKKLSHNPIRYIGRDPSSTPATGQYRQHVLEQQQILQDALS